MKLGQFISGHMLGSMTQKKTKSVNVLLTQSWPDRIERNLQLWILYQKISPYDFMIDTQKALSGFAIFDLVNQ